MRHRLTIKISKKENVNNKKIRYAFDTNNRINHNRITNYSVVPTTVLHNVPKFLAKLHPLNTEMFLYGEITKLIEI